MLELPEALNMAKQLNSAAVGKRVSRVLPPTKPHKFCWFCGDPANYNDALKGRCLASAEGFGIFAELSFEGGRRLCINDGVNLRLVGQGELPRDYQLAICFEDGDALCFSVAMYGGIYLHDGSYDSEYYLSSKNAVSLLSDELREYYYSLLSQSKQSLSAKAFLATEQRFPGLGNGVLQDILFDARINPKRKLEALGDAEREALLCSMQRVLRDMLALGGRDTEKDLFGKPGGYITKMSKNTLAFPCPVCGGSIIKEAYLGGAVYYCPNCQQLVK